MPDLARVTPGRRGLLGGAAALLAGAGLPIGGKTKAAVQAAASGPDAALIRLCAQYIVNLHAYNTSGGEMDSGDDPLWHAYERTRDAIHAAEPCTIDGMLAKAQAAKVEARDPDGGETPEYCPAADWAWDLVNDLLRLRGAVA